MGTGRSEAGADGTIRLSEILGALSHALDLTEGQPPGHCLRATWIGVHVGRALGLGEAALRDVYYTSTTRGPENPLDLGRGNYR